MRSVMTDLNCSAEKETFNLYILTLLQCVIKLQIKIEMLNIVWYDFSSSRILKKTIQSRYLKVLISWVILKFLYIGYHILNILIGVLGKIGPLAGPA